MSPGRFDIPSSSIDGVLFPLFTLQEPLNPGCRIYKESVREAIGMQIEALVFDGYSFKKYFPTQPKIQVIHDV